MTEIARALVVLAMFVFLLGTPAFANPPPTVVQQATALLTGQSLCGHGQQPLACHAPNGCCRAGLAVLPPRDIAPEPAYRSAIAVDYAAYRPAPAFAATSVAFRSRAPPV